MHSIWIAALLTLQGTTVPSAPIVPPGQASIPAPPLKNQWVVDEAGLLDSAGRQVVDSITRARAQIGMPLFVLTIRSVAAHDSTDMTVEQFSKETFDSWRRAAPGSDHAALLLVSAEDRRARIETGPAWGHDHDAMLQHVLSDAIEPSFSRNSLDQGIPTAAHEITWVLQAPPVSPWMREGLIGSGVVLAGALALGFLRRRRATLAASSPPPPPAEQPRPMAAIDPKLRVSQRLQAIDEARKHSEKAASSIAWLDTGEMPKYEAPPEPAAPREPETPAATDDDEE